MNKDNEIQETLSKNMTPPFNIPLQLWIKYDYFDGKLTDELIQLIDLPEWELFDALLHFNLRTKTDKHCAWLGIAFNHQDFGLEKLLQLAQALEIHDEDLINLAAIYGHLELFKSLEKSLNLVIGDKRLISALNLAAEHGHLSFLQYFEENVSDKEAIKTTNYYASRLVARNGHLSILKYLEEKAPDKLQEMIAAKNYDAFRLAAANGHLSILKYLEEKASDKLQEMIAAENYDAFRLAAANGHLSILKYLEEKASDKLQEMIAAEDYDAFRQAAESGHIFILKYLEEKAPGKLQEMIAAQGFYAFSWAAANGHLSTLKYLEEKAPDQLQEMIKAGDYYAFSRACRFGHLTILEYLEEKAPDQLQEMIKSGNYYAFSRASEDGYLAILKYLEEKAPDQLQEMIKADDYYAFREAGENGHLAILEYLGEKAPDQLQEMIGEVFSKAAKKGHLSILKYFEEKTPDKLQALIAAENYYAFRRAGEKGHLFIVKYLEEKAPDKLKEMIAAEDYYTFRGAAENGHFSLLQYLEEKAPDLLQEMIAAVNYDAFRWAAEKGHFFILKYLEEKAPDKLPEMIAAENYYAFRWAAEKGHLTIIQYLGEKAPDKLPEMIAAENYYAFRGAAENGHISILNYLEQKAPDKLQEMIRAKNYNAFRCAASIGHLPILKYFEEKAPDELQAMIAAENYYAFRCAAGNGHLPTLKYLEEKAPNQLQEMIAANDFYPFRGAVSYIQKDVANYLLKYNRVFSFAEQHDREYGVKYVYPFVQQKLTSLRTEKALLEERNPRAIYDVESNEAKLLFYVIRNLIRRNPENLSEDLLFLLEIPAVKALIHTPLTRDFPNELLRFALSQDNEVAAEILLTIPAVRELAEQHDYYRHEVRGGLDLRAFAQNRESSMTALTEGEQQRLKAVIDRYQPSLTEASVAKVMNDLREVLERRFKASPPTIIRENGAQLQLPLQWAAFNKLKLTPDEKEAAFKAYYEHTDHTAWRYLSKPNPWMHEFASYVYVNPDNLKEKWSTFEDYQSLIALLYLAAIDEKTDPIDGYTLETRQSHYFEELAQIARAHNWDKERIKCNKEGAPLLDQDNEVIKEEYDDLEGDRPSCYSGVKRRLFQAVQGHPLLVFLTKDKLDVEIGDYIRDCWQKLITEENKSSIESVWTKWIEGDELEDDEWVLLKTLDMTPEHKKAFEVNLLEKYGPQATAEKGFKAQIENAFKKLGKYDAHLIHLGHLHPETLFTSKAKAERPVATSSQIGMFAQASLRVSTNVEEASYSKESTI